MNFRLSLFVLLMACGDPQYSPWYTVAPNTLKKLTEINLEALRDTNLRSDTMHVAIIADPQGHPLALKRIVACLNKDNDIDFTVVVGDLTDYGLLHEYLWAAESLSKLDTPWLTIIGNHDSLSYGQEIYQSVFGKLNYTLDVGGTHFVFWNNNALEFNETNFEWLETSLQPASIVFSHIPPVIDQHSRCEIKSWLEIYQKSQVAVSIHGHRGSQKGELFKKNGVNIFIAPRANNSVYSVMKLESTAIFEIYDAKCRKQETYAAN